MVQIWEEHLWWSFFERMIKEVTLLATNKHCVVLCQNHKNGRGVFRTLSDICDETFCENRSRRLVFKVCHRCLTGTYICLFLFYNIDAVVLALSNVTSPSLPFRKSYPSVPLSTVSISYFECGSLYHMMALIIHLLKMLTPCYDIWLQNF